jgi:L-rhamnose isomerase
MSKQVEEFNVEVPLWLVASLGKKVALVKDFFDGVHIYPAGYEGVLMAIRGADMPSVSVDVCINPDDPTDWERFTPSELRPVVDEISYSLDIERGVIAFKVP